MVVHHLPCWLARIRKEPPTPKPKAPRTLWTPQRDEVLSEMYLGGYPVEDIGEALETTTNAIYQRALRLGLSRKRRFWKTPERAA